VRSGLCVCGRSRGRTTRSGLTAEVAFEVVSSSLAGEEVAEDVPAGRQERIHAPVLAFANARRAGKRFETSGRRSSLVHWGGVAYSRLDSLLLNGCVSWMFRNRTGASRPRNPANQPVREDWVLTEQRSPHHAEYQPVHLRIVGGLEALHEGNDAREGV
jgi:hypothetical protein